VLAGFASPAELVAEINRAGHPARSWALLAELLVIAQTDRSAGRAVLQAVTPGIQHATTVRWRRAVTTAGPWRTVDEIATDAISAAWEAIHAHSGRHEARPAQVIVRHVERALRRTHSRWIRESKTIKALGTLVGELSATSVAAEIPEERAAALIGEAVRCGVIDPVSAALLTATGVLGYPATEAARILALPYRALDRRLRTARRLVRTWLGDAAEGAAQKDPAEDTNFLISGLVPRRYQLSEPAPQLQFPFDDDHRARPVESRPFPIPAGASE
jgi:DNA-directed RNA polymerase specialized sigma24 family protein